MARKVSTSRKLILTAGLIAAVAMMCFSQDTFAWLIGSDSIPVIDSSEASFNARTGKLTIRGSNFQTGASITLAKTEGAIAHGKVKVKRSSKIIISKVAEADLADGLDVTVTNPGGISSATVHVDVEIQDDRRLSASDVRRVIAQAVAEAEAIGLRATIAVVDAEGNILGVYRMRGAPDETRVGGPRRRCSPNRATPPLRCGLEGVFVPNCTAAISKAITGSFLSSQGHAFSTRTASFIVQEHFPPGVDFQPSGPLFGVQFSQLLCSDVNARSPLGLSADPGGIPLYKNGLKVGGVGIEGDGKYALDLDPNDDDTPPEEVVAVAASRGFEAPAEIAGTIMVNGILFPYVNAQMPPARALAPLDDMRIDTCLGLAPAAIRGFQPTRFQVITLDPSIPDGRVDARFFPFQGGSVLSANDVRQLLVQAARQAFIMRAAIRRPANSPTEVNMTVVDVDGTILGIFSTIDAPIFGFDVSAQKARTAAFFTSPTARQQLRNAGFGRYVDAASDDGLGLDGSVAFSDRAGGFLSRPFFPDGINDTEHGPFSVDIEDFSPFNDGLQLDLILNEYFVNLLALNGNAFTPPCPSIQALANGSQIFPGSVPLFKNGRFAGGIGVSGDGVDQDDMVASFGSANFESPLEMRSDRVFVRNIRLPFVKFPRHPNR
ncbi:MAG: heme-binding protein [Acidobacteriota bacterium]